MVQINFALKEVNCKLVYYGPGLSGKTTNLEVVHSKAPSTNVGDLTSIATEGDRTLFFDFLPLNLGPVAGMTTKFQIYTVPGQVYYNSTRKLVLQGADGIVFVADSRRGKMDENIESYSNLEENLREYGMDITTTPLVLQYNKRDLPDIYAVSELDEKLNKHNSPCFEAVAVTGEGVFSTLKKLSQMVLESLNRQQASMAVRGPRKPGETKTPISALPVSSRAKASIAVPVAAHADAKSMGGTSALSLPEQSAPRAGGTPTPAPGALSSKNAQKNNVRVLREQVSDSSGVKSIERKSPAAPSTEEIVRKKVGPGTQKVAVKDNTKPSGKSGGLIVALLLAAAAAGSAALYLCGVLG